MRRDDLVTIALQGAYGKPRPALIIQSDLFSEHPSVTILPVTSDLRDTPLFRVRISHDEGNGLSKLSEVMVDKVQTAMNRLQNAVVRWRWILTMPRHTYFYL